MKRPFTRKPSQTFGLDIGTSAVKIAQLEEASGRWTLTALGVVPLPAEAIVDGNIQQRNVVVDAIKECLDRAGITSRDAAIGVAGRDVITKKIRLAGLVPRQEVAGAVQLEAEHHIPFALDDVFLDYHVVRQHEGGMDILIVAVKRSKVNEYVGVVQEADLDPVVVDIDDFALGNQFELNHPDDGRDAVGLIDMGAAVMNTNIVHGGNSMFARDIPFGGRQYTQAIADRLGIAFDEAERAKTGEATVAWDAIVPALETVSRDFALEVRRTFDYFGSTADAERIGRVVLSGGAARLHGLTDYLSASWHIPVEVARPLQRVDVPPAFMAEAAAAGPGLAVAVGLALRRPGDRRG
jgi:type IV pilus assembly protein PilM